MKRLILIILYITLLCGFAFSGNNTSVYISDDSIKESEISEIDVHINTDKEIGFAQFVFEYDSTIVTYLGYSLSTCCNNFQVIQNLNLPFNPDNSQSNKNFLIQINGNGTNSFSGDNIILTLQFQSIGTAGESSPLAVSRDSEKTSLATTGLIDISDSDIDFRDGVITIESEFSGPIRVNAGGSDFTNANGYLFHGDKPYSSGDWGYVGGNTYRTSNSIDGTVDDVLYQTERYGMSSYRFDVPEDDYLIILHFAEIYFQRNNARLFNVNIEGTSIYSNFDIYSQAGRYGALVDTISTKEYGINVSDGSLDISFSASVDEAKISAIEIVKSGSIPPKLSLSTRQLNFGLTQNIMSFEIRNLGGGILDWEVSEYPSASWVTINSLKSGRLASHASAIVEIEIDRSGLSQGSYTNAIRVNSSVGIQDVNIVMTVPGPPTLLVSPESLDFGPSSSSLNLTIKNSGGGTLSWSISENPDVDWLVSIDQTSGDLELNQSQSLIISIDRSGLADGNYETNLTVQSNGGSATVPVYISKSSAPAYVQRINCGSKTDFSDKDGNEWAGDQAYMVGGFGYVGGNLYETSDPISGTENDPLYQSERWGLAAYRFDVPDGIYQVTLHFAEIYCRSSSQRLINVAIENQQVLQSLDIYERVGHDAALQLTYSDVQVTDGRLDITFSSSREQPKISAIEILSASTDPVLSLNQTSLDFGLTQSTLTFAVENSGGETLSWNAAASPSSNWITSITPSSGSLSQGNSQDVTITIDRTGLAEGSFIGSVQVSSNGGSGQILLSMTVPGPPTLQISTSSLNLGSKSTTASFLVTNDGGGTLSWSAAENPDQQWITGVQPQTGELDAGESQSVTVTIDRDGLAENDYTGAISLTSNGGNEEISVSMSVASQPSLAYRINCGSKTGYTDGNSNQWVADQAYSAGSYGYAGGDVYSTTDGISGTNDDPVYQSERWGLSAYRFDVPVGTYQVVLHFAEIYCKSSNARLINAAIEGTPVLHHLDIFKEVGHDAALSYTYSDVSVTDGRLDILFGSIREQPKISGIEVIAMSSDPKLTVNSTSLDYGTASNSLTFTISNSGGETLNWIAAETSEVSWITSISPSSGSLIAGANKSVTVNIDRGELSKNSYAGSITVTSNGGNSVVNVSMKVAGPPQILVSPTTLDFGTSESEMNIVIKNTGGETLSWIASKGNNEEWISFTNNSNGELTQDQEATLKVKVARTGLEENDYTGTVEITSNGGNQSVNVSMTVTAVPSYSKRINCGDKTSYTDSENNEWLADVQYSTGGFGYVGGNIYSRNDAIAGTNSDQLFQTERYGMSEYRFDVENGHYNVILYFAEIYFNQSNKRIFHVNIEGQRVLSNFDIFKEAGHDVALSRSFSVDVTDGQLNVSFIANIEDCKISAIHVTNEDQEVIKKKQIENEFNNSVEIPERFELFQNYPNPFNPITHIRYCIPYENHVKIKIFDLLGKEVLELVDDEKQPGEYMETWNGNDENGNKVPSSIYICHIQFGNQVKTIKMTMVK